MKTLENKAEKRSEPLHKHIGQNQYNYLEPPEKK